MFKMRVFAVLLSLVLIVALAAPAAWADPTNADEPSAAPLAAGDIAVGTEATEPSDTTQASETVDTAPVPQTEQDLNDKMELQDAFSVLSYQTHVSTIGWVPWVQEGQTSGTTGRALQAEAISIYAFSPIVSGGVEYRAYVGDVGWTPWVSNRAGAGTTGQSKRIEAISVRLTGGMAQQYDIYYCTHISGVGWLGWARNGADAGTIGHRHAIEAMQIQLVQKGGAAPGKTDDSLRARAMTVDYQAHVSAVGWQGWTEAGNTAGTTGRGLAMEALSVSLINPVLSGGIEYRAHVQAVGWQAWTSGEKYCGTTGRSLRMEALSMRLTGEMEKNYHIYYRAHIARLGWLTWAKDGQNIGSSGYSIAIEAIQIVLVPRGASAPEVDSKLSAYIAAEHEGQAFVEGKNWLGAVSGENVIGTTGEGRRMYAFKLSLKDFSYLSTEMSGGIRYTAHVSGIGWTGESQDGEVVGDPNAGQQVEAVTIQLSGELARYFSVYYRVHCEHWGWLGWAKNGENAGTSALGYRMEAMQIMILPQICPAPGSGDSAYVEGINTTGDQWLNRQLLNITRAYGNDLYRCFNHVASDYSWFYQGDAIPSGDWAVPYGKECIVNNGGNCYRSAALFCLLAKQLGYDARAVTGTIPSASQGSSPHGWVEINLGGTVYVCDPTLARDYPTRNWYMVTYANAPIDFRPN